MGSLEIRLMHEGTRVSDRICEVDAIKAEIEPKAGRIKFTFGRFSVASIGGSVQRSRVLNAVPLQNALLCAECDVVSDSPHDVCMVCGSHSLFSIARIFGGKLPDNRVAMVRSQPAEAPRETVLIFPKPHRPRRRATGSHQLFAPSVDDHETQPDRAMFIAPHGD